MKKRRPAAGPRCGSDRVAPVAKAATWESVPPRGVLPAVLAEAKRLLLQAFIAEAFVGAADEERLSALALTKLEAML